MWPVGKLNQKYALKYSTSKKSLVGASFFFSVTAISPASQVCGDPSLGAAAGEPGHEDALPHGDRLQHLLAALRHRQPGQDVRRAGQPHSLSLSTPLR